MPDFVRVIGTAQLSEQEELTGAIYEQTSEPVVVLPFLEFVEEKEEVELFANNRWARVELYANHYPDVEVFNVSRGVLSHLIIPVQGKKSLKILVLELLDVDAEAFENVVVRIRPPRILHDLRVNETEEIYRYRVQQEKRITVHYDRKFKRGETTFSFDDIYKSSEDIEIQEEIEEDLQDWIEEEKTNDLSAGNGEDT